MFKLPRTIGTCIVVDIMCEGNLLQLCLMYFNDLSACINSMHKKLNNSDTIENI